MTQFYLNPERELLPHALPNAEAFYVDARGYVEGEPYVLPHEPGEQAFGLAQPGWYWWPCFPGCLPDSEPSGPFTSKEEAIEDAQEE